MNSTRLKVGACQTSDIQGDIESALAVIGKFALQADSERVTILCFPECFLQGYTLESRIAHERAIDLSSFAFAEILKRLGHYETLLVIGLIEADNGALFNTAVVIHSGQLVGIYRKTHIHPKEVIFQAGRSHPVFEVAGRRFGVNICHDARFEESAAQLAQQGTQLILYPLNNLLPVAVAQRWRTRHIELLRDRAKQTGALVVSADVVADRGDAISYGCTAIIGRDGGLIQRVPERQLGLVVADAT